MFCVAGLGLFAPRLQQTLVLLRDQTKFKRFHLDGLCRWARGLLQVSLP